MTRLITPPPRLLSLTQIMPHHPCVDGVRRFREVFGKSTMVADDDVWWRTAARMEPADWSWATLHLLTSQEHRIYNETRLPHFNIGPHVWRSITPAIFAALYVRSDLR